MKEMRTNVHGQTIESNLGFSILWTTRPRPEPPEGFKNDVVHFLNPYSRTHISLFHFHLK